jgi:hypothetical protein
LNHEDSVDHGLSDARPNAALVRASVIRVARRPVDLVHDPRLRFVRRGREGEIRVATGVEEDAELGIDPAVLSVSPRVGETPVAVDEPIAGPTVRISREEPVLGVGLQVRPNVVLELRGVVAVMMKVELDLAQTGLSESAERCQIVRGILLPRKEERVPRRPSVRVPKLAGEEGILPFPTVHAVSPSSGIGAAPEGLVVVTHGKEHVFRALRERHGETLERVKAVAPNPAVVLLERERERHHGRIS